jgi:hypothetical protein
MLTQVEVIQVGVDCTRSIVGFVSPALAKVGTRVSREGEPGYWQVSKVYGSYDAELILAARELGNFKRVKEEVVELVGIG